MTSTTEIPSNILEASKLLAARLRPAKLAEDGSQNGITFNAYLLRMGKASQVLSMTASELCDLLYRAVQEDVQSAFPALQWHTPPKSLAKRNPAKATDPRTEAVAFEARVRKGERDAAAKKLQDEAKKRCELLIARFTPVNKRGLLVYALRDEYQAAWKAKIAKTSDFVSLERTIKDEQRKVYDYLDSKSERL